MQTSKKRTSIINYTDNTKEEISKQGIYCIYHIDKPNTFYVGLAKSFFNKRWLKHLSDLRLNRHHSVYLQNTYNKYGHKGIKFKILEFIKNKSDFSEKEKYWIKKLNSYHNGFNLTEGGEDFQITEEIRKKMIENSALRGKHGKDHPMSTKVYRYDLEGNYIDYFESLTDAANFLGINYTGITHAINDSNMKQYKHFQWFYTFQGDRIPSVKYWYENRHKKVVMLDIETNKRIRIFKSVTEAANYLNTSTTNISKACKNNKYSCKGYKWKYTDIEESN